MALFNNNFKFHHKNSASPSLCLLVKNINNSLKKTGMNNTPVIQKILNTLNYEQDDFKYCSLLYLHIHAKQLLRCYSRFIY